MEAFLKYRAVSCAFTAICLCIIVTACRPAPKENLTTVENRTQTENIQVQESPPVRDYARAVQVGGLERKYWVHLPQEHSAKIKWPLLIQLHGGGGEGRQLNALTGFYALADKQKFIVFSPDAIERNWNDGRGDFNARSHVTNVDDVGFISFLIDSAVSELNADPGRVYLTGISNGALMTHRASCQLSQKIAAIACVAGNFPYGMASVLSPSRPMPVLLINGTDDPLVPYNGGNITFGALVRGKVLSVADTVSFWATKNGCRADPAISNLPDVADDGTSVVTSRYPVCAGSAEVILYTINNGGHTWPGGLQYLPEGMIGKTCRDFNASEAIWGFFSRHPLN
jgi:polyhydroxybutyrate depolymerase